MSDRIRLALLIFVVMTCVTARVGGALGATGPVDKPLSHTTVVARNEARVARFARRFLGVPYRWGGTSPASGFDCSGFTRFVYAHFGITLPHYTGSQFAMGQRVSRWGLRPGDLVFSNGVGHVGLYIGSGLMIHAPRSGYTVTIAPVSDGFDGARRLLH